MDARATNSTTLLTASRTATTFCPGTLSGEEVNVFGCLRSAGPVISLCGSFSNLTLTMMVCGLVALRLTYRRM